MNVSGFVYEEKVKDTFLVENAAQISISLNYPFIDFQTLCKIHLGFTNRVGYGD